MADNNKSTLIIGLTLLIAVVAVIGVHQLLQTPEGELETVSEETREMLLAVFPEEAEFALVEHEGEEVYVALENDETIGLAAVSAGEGYGGPIEVLTGTNPQGEIIGISVLDHSETDGLGDRVEEAEFRERFHGLTVDDPITIGEDVDGLTGATVSAEAVAEAVRDAMGVISSASELEQL